MTAPSDPVGGQQAAPPIVCSVARPTTDLARVRRFYEHVAELPLIGSFVDHDGFDGAIFGLTDERNQLELVRSPHANAPELTDEPNLNPYWPRHGARAFADPDGYRLIVVPMEPAP